MSEHTATARPEDASKALEQCFSTGQINSLSLKNRIIKSATFEGMSKDGIPSQRLKDFHLNIAAGGTAMTTLAYCGAEADGRLHENMMYMGEYIRSPLTTFIEELHQAGTKVSGQLAHCGGFSKNKKLQKTRPLGPSWGINMLGLAYGMFLTGKMNHRDIDQLVESFAEAATFMQSVGFDCIEIHFGHGYGLSQFISPITNKRKDEYGGSLENRMRLPLRVLAAVRQAVGDDFPLLGKISLTDGVRGGIHYDDAVQVAQMLDAAGIDGIITSGGTSSMNPMIMFRGDNIAHGLIENEKNPIMKLGLKLMGPKMFKDYPYKEMYFLEQAKKVRASVKCKVIYIGGVCSNTSLATLMQAGFDFVQLGRGLIADPDFVKHAQADKHYINRCTHCNRCVSLIDDPQGIRCVL